MTAPETLLFAPSLVSAPIVSQGHRARKVYVLTRACVCVRVHLSSPRRSSRSSSGLTLSDAPRAAQSCTP